jgi:hydroxymethylpyrimidine pyrophosphatase-like HAD family hydrolase
MGTPFRAIAVDYDGTLTLGSRPSEEVLAALAEARATGVKILLVTGRILSELLADFPEARDRCDVIVAENGTVLWTEATGLRAIAAPVSEMLDQALRARQVLTRRGNVILATDARYDGVVLEEIARLGADYQLVRNRAALMILPAGRTKGTGVVEALGELGISSHSVMGIGDAENDHSLLEACELGVAVGNAIPSLKAHADIVLESPDGVGVARLVRELVRGELPSVATNRWRVSIGARADGSIVTLPGSGINVLITGGSGSGKSYLAGLLAERLMQLGYSIFVFDPEGDHTQVGSLRGTITLGGADPVPLPSQLGHLVHRRYGGAVVDLSLLAPDEKVVYVKAALQEIEQHRTGTGFPHWIFLDEAHVALGRAIEAPLSPSSTKGYCLVTYHPAELSKTALASIDVVFLLPHSEEVGRELLEEASQDAGEVANWLSVASGLHRGQALMLRMKGQLGGEVVTLGRRRSRHVRHRHKYVHGYLPPRHHFRFRDDHGLSGRYAANLEDFDRELRVATDAVLVHHLGCGDFSRWIGDVLQDATLAAAVYDIEQDPCDPRLSRANLVDAIERRYAAEEDGTLLPVSSSSVPPGSPRAAVE